MIDFLQKASQLYYSGNPIISDAEFDSLSDRYNFEEVGHKVTDGVPHLFRMYSLQKEFDPAKIAQLGEEYICTPKLDGAAVSLLYVNGLFALGLTRGDGNLGRDITDKLATLVPERISLSGEVQITGEVVHPATIDNARNVAAGLLNVKSLTEFSERSKPLKFVAYDIQGASYATWTQAMKCLNHQGFEVVTHFDATKYPADGEVYRVDDYVTFYKMGYTARHPRGAFAFKVQQEGVTTELLDVVWQVGKSGVVSPVALLEPVEVGGALVSRATLHNIEYIRSLNLEIGCKVAVIRSGDIIPRIISRVDLAKNSS